MSIVKHNTRRKVGSNPCMPPNLTGIPTGESEENEPSIQLHSWTTIHNLMSLGLYESNQETSISQVATTNLSVRAGTDSGTKCTCLNLYNFNKWVCCSPQMPNKIVFADLKPVACTNHFIVSGKLLTRIHRAPIARTRICP